MKAIPNRTQEDPGGSEGKMSGSGRGHGHWLRLSRMRPAPEAPAPEASVSSKFARRSLHEISGDFL